MAHKVTELSNRPINVRGNRAAKKWSKRSLALRGLWALAWPLFALSPRPMWGWRTLLLKAFGAKIGKDVHVFPSVRITIPWHISIDDGAAVGDRAILYALGSISIGKRVTVSQNAHLCAGSHNYESRAMELLKSPISIEDDAWVCADAFIGPGVTIGSHSVVGARAVAMKDVAPNTVVAGNPAQKIRSREMR